MRSRAFLFVAALAAFPVYALAQAAAGTPGSSADLLAQAKSYYLLYGPAFFTGLYFLAQAIAHIAPPTSRTYKAADWFLTGPARAFVPKSVTGSASKEPSAPVLLPPAKGFALVRIMLVCAALAALLGYRMAYAQEVAPPACPATLCAIGQQGNWGFGILPTLSTVGVDLHHGTIVGGLQIGTSLAATWMPGQLKSVTFGAHAGVQGANSGAPTTFNLGGTVSFLRGYGTIIFDWQAIGGSHAFVLAPALGVPF